MSEHTPHDDSYELSTTGCVVQVLWVLFIGGAVLVGLVQSCQSHQALTAPAPYSSPSAPGSSPDQLQGQPSACALLDPLPAGFEHLTSEIEPVEPGAVFPVTRCTASSSGSAGRPPMTIVVEFLYDPTDLPSSARTRPVAVSRGGPRVWQQPDEIGPSDLSLDGWTNLVRVTVTSDRSTLSPQANHQAQTRNAVTAVDSQVVTTIAGYLSSYRPVPR